MDEVMMEKTTQKIDGVRQKHTCRTIFFTLFYSFFDPMYTTQNSIKHRHTHPHIHFSPLCGLAQAAWQLLSVYVLVFKLRMIGGRPSPQRAASTEPG